ncbi:MAG TPA: tetratricopeptide repeat protein [Anaerolineales bacterium]|nr:tetratricopeptide repeat protein [Anaerolineales bacterium]
MAKVSLRAYNREIETMIDSGHLDEAIAHSKHILKSFPKHLDTYRLLGKAYLEYKHYPDAVDVFSRVLVVVPNDFVSHVGMSIIRDEENKLDDAIWHMERAFETQPSNAAIQSELQRLYSRRDGVQLPRIRMTRGALAQMYVQGELYPQAISEIKSVLKEDPGRNDMQVLLSRAYYRSGLKNDAAEVASSVLRSNPYCLDANRVVVDILGADHPESVQAYRQRIIELDPYASQVTGSMFSSNEVPDLAVSLERLDWNGQPVGAQSDWEMTQAVSLESGQRTDEQPDWLKGTVAEPAFDHTQGGSVPAFDMSTPPAEPAEDIPDFLQAAGWGQSTGSFDESKPVFADAERESASPAEPIEQGDLPDWVKAMAPQQSAPTPPQGQAQEPEEEMPDWINKIGTSALPLPSESNDQPDWMSQMEQPAAQPADNQPDWLKGFETEAESTVSPASTGDLDWLSQLSGESKPLETSSNEFDFLNQPAGESGPAVSSSSDFDFLNQPLSEPESASSSNEFDFLKELGSQPETTPAASSTEDFDFLNELSQETEQLAPASAPTPEPFMNAKDNLGMSDEERDDSFAWLENLAAKQGATEGLLTKPEDRLEEEPEWVKQAKGADVSQPPVQQPPVQQPVGNLEELGKSEQEQDDSFAWLENLAAKQGATEGLLTKPEERLEQEPEWIRQAKSLKDQSKPPAQVPPEETLEIPVTKPSASLEELGKSEKEQDDSFAWLENLAAKQGATEGLLTTPEERLQEEPDWVKQAKDLSAEQLSTSDPAPSMDDTAMWLRSLDQEAKTEAEPASKDDTAIWFKKLEESEETTTQPVESTPSEDLPAWMQNIEEEQASETQFNIPISDIASSTAAKEASELPEVSEWMSSTEPESIAETAASIEETTPELQAEDIPSWLNELDREEDQAVTPTAMDADLPAWLRDETGELVAEPTRIEPTRATDWQPIESQPEPEVQAPKAEPEAIMPQPEPVMAQPEVQSSQPEALDVVNIIEERIAAIQEPAPPVEPPKPVAKLKGTGKLSMPMDPILGQARTELAGSNLNGALESYTRLIKKGRFLDEVIYDLRDASYRFPVDVNIWQSLGDAYMRANRLQDALDAYTKAEELLR